MYGKISVIIPAYNCEATIEFCIESIKKQTYSDLEIIIVDDGSEDKTFEICNKLSQLDNRIKVFHKKNGGQASARNYGLDMCTGEFITFVDDDDYIDNVMYETLLMNMSKNKVMIAGCATRCEDISGKNIASTQFGKSGLKKGEDIIFNILYRTKACWGTVWNKIFDSRLKEKLYFPEGCELEDYYVILRLMLSQKEVYYDMNPCYHWIQRSSSQSHRGFHENRLTEIDIIDDVIDYYKKHSNSNKLIKASKHFKAVSVSSIIILMWKAEDKKIEKKINDEFNSYLFQIVKYGFSFRHFRFQSFKDVIHAMIIISVCEIRGTVL